MSEPTKAVLDPASLLHTVAQITPKTLQSPYDALAAATHAIMLSVGCRFAGLGDDARQEGDGSVRTLPEAWNSQGPSCYAFRYSHPQSSMTFCIKSLKLGNRFIMHGIAIEDNKTATLDIDASHFTSNAFFPYDPRDSKDPLVHGLISTSQFQEFVNLFKINILQRILPGLQKPGYEDTCSSATTASRTQQPPPSSSTTTPPSTRPPIFDDPTAADDTYYDPFNVGRSDLEPMGGGLRMPGDGGGMFVGPHHPMFGGVADNSPDARLPPGAAPPGARFDPIGPFMPDPRRGGAGGLGRSGRGGGRGRGGVGRFSGEPDNDELPPPNFDNYFM
ncbi:PI31 proteasome regulator N-terminal-domain-containing protein [Zychaea mexicana]|uniref:PI31 proteasome regulator N-terminal-domain-containing protein n=1 Tax=Zychaea mexicana TaxID=64656 RepID=UPI0022FDE5F4|nr:PI31 proteasome regulator N-terminal-domain-containing protein [Zychaea mexicana]KAI9498870.1 PI31 proteasome regulator N-terminal-domain-containing protein [Zychaea mexicana]